jgi:glycosyltransferase involved in cell wall biosynthesis
MSKKKSYPSPPLLTVITVVYNDAENLKGTLENIAAQTDQDFEYLVLDGGSTDGTLDLIHTYEEYITHWISEPDGGIYNAMNKGIEMAQGRYVNFMNAGDAYYEAHTLAEVKAALDAHPETDLLYGKLLNYSNGEQGVQYVTGEPVSPWALYKSIPICHQTEFIRRELFAELGLYTTDLKIASDYEWVVRYYDSRKTFDKCFFLDRPLIVYQHGGYSFKNMRKVAHERRKIGDQYFPLPYRLVNWATTSLQIVKSYLIPLVMKMKILDLYRALKYRKSLASGH